MPSRSRKNSVPRVAGTPLPIRPVEITHVSVVTRDLRKTMRNYHEILGWEPWNGFILKPPRHTSTELHGKPTHFTMEAASTQVGSINFEIIQPLEGPSVYKEFLEQHGEGFQHMSCWQWLIEEDARKMLDAFKQRGIGVAMTGLIDGHLRYYYLDTLPTVKIHIEVAKSGAPGAKPDWVYP